MLGVLTLSPQAMQAATKGTGHNIPVTSSPARNPDVAYDAQNNVFLGLTGNAVVQAQFVSPTGAMLPGAFGGRFNITTSSEYQHSPSAHCAGGACLVVWHQGSPVRLMARIVSYTAGFVSQPVAVGPLKTAWEFGAGIAYSSAANEFFVTWMGDFPAANNIYYARISAAGQVLQATALTTSAAYERQPSVAYNPVSDEFVIAYAGTRDVSGVETGYVRSQRVKNGALVGGPSELYLGGGTYIPIAEYVSVTQAVAVAWVRGAKTYGRLVHANGSLGAQVTISSTYGSYDALDLAFNPVTASILLITHGQGAENVSIELSTALLPSAVATATDSGGSGNYNPRIASSTVDSKWLVATSRNFKSLWVQFGHGTPSGPPPPPPPPPCAISLGSTSVSVSGAGGNGTVSLTPDSTPCSWGASSNAAWLTVSPTSGTAAATLNWTAQPNTTGAPRSAVITAGGKQISVSQGIPGYAMQFDGSGDGDLLAYTPSSGGFATYLGNGGGFAEGPSGGWLTGWSVQAARFNGDDLADLFFYNPSNGEWLKGINTGGALSFYGGTWALGWEPHIIDLDGDGDSDVFLHNPSTGAWQRCLSTAVETLSCAAGTPVWAPGWKVYPAKFNNDQYGDLFLYSTSVANGGRWFKVLGNAGGAFEYVEGDLRWASDWTITPGDFDGDGLTDLMLYRTSDGQVFRVKFTATSAIYTGSVWGKTWTVTRGDFNGDRRTDVLLYDPNNSDGRWAIAISNAGGWFDFYYPVVGAGLGWTPYVGYLNGDAKSDIVWYYQATGATVAWYATTPGSFTVVTGPTVATNSILLLKPYSLP